LSSIWFWIPVKQFDDCANGRCAARASSFIFLYFWIRTRDVNGARAVAKLMGHHLGDERCQSVRVLTDGTGDDSHVAVQQAGVDGPFVQA